MLDHNVASEGFTIVSSPDHATVDIVFIHGLEGSPLKTWSGKLPGADFPDESDSVISSGAPDKRAGNGCWGMLSCIFPSHEEEDQPHNGINLHQRIFWPKELLASEEWCQNARILTYGYDASISRRYEAANRNDFFTHAKDLLYALERTKPARRPVIFVVHSMGGLILKETLRRSDTAEEDEFKDIIRSTLGIIFLGTPHRGNPGMASLGEVVLHLAGSIAKVDSNSTLLRTLGTDSPELELGREAFLSIWRKYSFRVKTFQEAYPFTGVNVAPLNQQVVLPASSSLDDPREHAESIPANHVNMCKFSSSSDPGYVKVSAEIRTMVLLSDKEPEISPIGQEFLNKLFFPAMYEREKNIGTALEDTCNWFHLSPQYQDWITRSGIDNHYGMLWVKGKPGSGKSTLMKEAVNRAKAQYEGTRVSVVAFFFNARGTERLEKTVMGLYRSLLHQVLQLDLLALGQLSLWYQKKLEKEKFVNWHEKDLQTALLNIFATSASRKAFIFIDAMDECNDDEVRRLVRFFRLLTTKAYEAGAALAVCLSSRHYPQITIDGCPEIVVEHNNRGDINMLIESESDGFRDLQELKEEIFEKSGGVFLWVVLVISILKKNARGKSIKWLRRLLSEIPEELDLIFTSLFVGVPVSELSQTVCLINLILFAREPMTLNDIHVALSFGMEAFPSVKSWKDSVYYLESSRKKRELVIELSKGMLEPINRESRRNPTYQFIHETAREYFLSGKGFELLGCPPGNVSGIGHETIARVCTRYLSVAEFTPESRSAMPALNASYEARMVQLGQFALLSYATNYMIRHVEEAEESGIAQDSLLLEIHNGLIERLSLCSDSAIAQFGRGTVLYFAAANEYKYVVYRLLSMGVDMNEPSRMFSVFPLLVAVQRRNYSMVKYLLQNGADVLTQDIDGNTALHLSTDDSSMANYILDASKHEPTPGGYPGCWRCRWLLDIRNNDGKIALELCSRMVTQDAVFEILSKKTAIWEISHDCPSQSNVPFPMERTDRER